MEGLHQLEIVILLLTIVLALTTLAQRLLIPYPILLVISDEVLHRLEHELDVEALRLGVGDMRTNSSVSMA